MKLDDLSPHRYAISSRRAEFVDAAFEDRFRRHVLPKQNAQLRASLVFAAVFFVLFGVTDLATLGFTVTAWALVALRVLVALVAMAGYAAVVRRPESPPLAALAASALLSAALAVFMAVAWYQPQALAWNTMSQAMILMAVYVNFPNRFVYSVTIGVVSSLVFGAMLVLQGMRAADDVLTLFLLLILGNALGYIAAKRIHLAQREAFRAAFMLQELADRDPLTGCYNRWVLERGLLDAELARCRRYGTALSVILCDLDHFKRINDAHGHATGDEVLRHFASLLRAMTRETIDSVIRYGGEEFLMVLPQTELPGALALAERIRLAFAAGAATTAAGARVGTTASFGVASVVVHYPREAPSVAALLAAADAQLYAVKRGGRNAVRGTTVDGADGADGAHPHYA